jgi:uncharacterized damage-inducible protein DinB
MDKASFEKEGEQPNNLPYSVFEQFYHIRFTQLDILKFIQEEDYKAPCWPDDYWPENKMPKNEAEWEDLKDRFFEERQQLITILNTSENDLFDLVKTGKADQTLIRELLLIIEHNAYHTGQILVMLRLLDLYK